MALFFILITHSINASSYSKMNPIFAEEVTGPTIQVDLDTIHRMAAETIAKDEKRKSDELHAKTLKHYDEIRELEISATKKRFAEEAERTKSIWLFNNPDVAATEYHQEKKRLDDVNYRNIQKDESIKRMKIAAEKQAAMDYETTHLARLESRGQMIAAFGYGMIGCGVGLLFMRSHM